MQHLSNVAIFFAILSFLGNEVYVTGEAEECNNITADTDIYSRCCKLPEFELSEEKKSIAEACHKNVVGDDQEPKTEKEEEKLYECFEECYFNASNWLTEELKLNETAILAEYDEDLRNFPEWKEPIFNTVLACVQNDFSNPEAKCKSGAYQFSNCLEVNIFLNCPADSWQGNDVNCTDTKRILEKCMTSTNKS